MSLIGTLTSGVSALRSFTKGLEVIGNNIANVNTTGFKASTVSFAESFSNTLRGSSASNGGGSNTSSMQIGTGVRLAQINARHTQGALTSTGVPTDLGVSGNGFFRVRNPLDGAEYVTRAGDFRIDDQGYLVTSHGYRVQGATGDVANGVSTTVGDIRLSAAGTVPTGADPTATRVSFSIDRQGFLVESFSDGTSAASNRVLLQNFTDPTGLQRFGENLYIGMDAAGPVGGLALDASATSDNLPGGGGLGSIESGVLELSNVDLTEEFANMIATQRSFQAGSRIVTVADSILEEIVNLKR
ncbi:MAG TPA: flagellar hook-basal body complex protein [Candidatus Synoicihabitans sp.]|nr:flagellar hook-basal body complex protein [Candidatus Synoicihabitans sp.]